jgi:asparagine N-glycosylation enzyme membrane subunit Stt3
VSESSENSASAARSSLALLAVLVLVAVFAWFPRSVPGLRHDYDGGASWFSRDPDGLYHARRVERALEEGEVAEHDPRMNFPDGAPIPWPPYYDRALAWTLGPFAPEGAERWKWIERAVSSAPRLFGVASALLAAFAAWRLGGLVAAVVAGLGVALCRGTINYSVIGTGDHHAWIALLSALTLVAASEGARTGALDSPRRGALLGALLGVLVGLMVGSWVAALLFLVIPLQLILACWIVARGTRALPGLAALGFTAHVVAALTLLPAVLSSPWRAEFPWMVVNLSWFHLAQLGLGALVFAPLFASSRFAPRTRAARLYPLVVAAALGGLALVAWALDLAPARGLAEGFAWASRADSFMDTVQESAPLVGARAESGVLFLALGYGILALPFALAWLARRAWRQRQLELTPWIVASAWLVGWALVQRRFADPLAVPMSVALGLGAARLASLWRPRVLAPLLCAASVLVNFPSASSAWRGLTRPAPTEQQRAFDAVLGERKALEWIRAQSNGDDRWSVLSHWDRGHVIEWASNAPSVATNFGSYIGVESYRDPPRFFLSEDPQAALELLERRHVRYVYAPASLIGVLRSQIRVADPALASVLLDARGPSRRYWGTMAGRLLSGGDELPPNAHLPVDVRTQSLDSLRLVHVTSERHPSHVDRRSRPLPAGFVWERVTGAQIRVSAALDELLQVKVAINFPASGYLVIWHGRARGDASGFASVRCPYSTDAPNGDGTVTGAHFRIGETQGHFAASREAVDSGAVVTLER